MTCGFNKTVLHATLHAKQWPNGEASSVSSLFLVKWPPISCDLTPLDDFLRGYVKAHVYSDKPATIDALEAYIEEFICDTRRYVGESMQRLDLAYELFKAQPRPTFT